MSWILTANLHDTVKPYCIIFSVGSNALHNVLRNIITFVVTK